MGGWGRAFLDHYDLDGKLLGSIKTKGTLNSGLAYDAADDTLWVAEGAQQRILRQYAKDGELLQIKGPPPGVILKTLSLLFPGTTQIRKPS